MRFSKKLDLFGDEVFAFFNQKRRELEAQGRQVWDLSVGTPDFEPYQHVMDAFVESAKDPLHWKYSLHDTDELLQAVCAYYERRYGVKGITPNMVMSVRGTQEGMAHLCAALTDPGDLVLIPDPCYPIFAGSAHMIGVEPWYYPLTEEHGFLPHVADIPDDVADRARYMIVSLPANPVGSVGTPEVYEEIIEFARKHDVVIIHDNAYSDIVDGERGGSFLAYPGALEVGCEFLSLSKSFNVTGLRISFLVGSPELVAATHKLRSQVDFGMPYPDQAAAFACLSGPLEQVEAQRKLYEERRLALYDGLESIGWERPKGTGTMFVWCKMPHGRRDSFDFALELMERSGVIVTPGASFGPHGEGYVRMALVLPPEGLREAVAAIAAAGM